MKFLKVLTASAIIIIIFYLSWVRNPNFDQLSVIPNWLNRWSNLHGQLRTAVPFIPLGFLLNTYKKKWYISLTGFLICLIVVIIAELGQFFIPTRYPDIIDVFFGVLGAVLGMVFQNIFQKIEVKV